MKKMLFVLALCALSSIACVTGPDSGAVGDGNAGHNDDDRDRSCCKECTHKSKPCGDTCISRDKSCHTDGGCAC
jgi:hypothetical protein